MWCTTQNIWFIWHDGNIIYFFYAILSEQLYNDDIINTMISIHVFFRYYCVKLKKSIVSLKVYW